LSVDDKLGNAGDFSSSEENPAGDTARDDAGEEPLDPAPGAPKLRINPPFDPAKPFGDLHGDLPGDAPQLLVPAALPPDTLADPLGEVKRPMGCDVSGDTRCSEDVSSAVCDVCAVCDVL